jgi:hypothetical protein
VDLKQLIKWAIDYKSNRVAEIPDTRNAKNRANNYLGMIINKGTKILSNNEQNADYMKNIEEYVEQLNKIDVRPEPDEPVLTKDSGGEPVASGAKGKSSLIPD